LSIRIFSLKGILVLALITTLLIVSAYFILHSQWFGRFIFPLPYKELIFTQAQERDLDPYLVAAVIFVESKFDPSAKSDSGALGLMQIMPTTGKWAAEKIGLEDFREEYLYDPQVNVTIGTWYLANLREEFGNNLVIMLAAYNGGRGNVKEWLQEELWTGEHNTVEQIPFPETKHYVLRVMAAYKEYKRLYREN